MMLRPFRALIVSASRDDLGYGIALNKKRIFTTTSRRSVHVGRSPTAKVVERNRRRTAPQADQSWPIAIIEAASRSGGLGVSSTTAVQILDCFKVLGRAPIKKELKTLFEEHKFKAQDLSVLAGILVRSRNRDHYIIAKRLIHAALDLRDRSAILFVVNSAIKSNSIDSPQHINFHEALTELAKTNDPTSLFLLGQIQLLKGNKTAALDYYEKARDTLIESPSEKALAEDFGQLYQGIALLKSAAGDHDGAVKVLEEGALRNDYASCYYHLADMYTSATSPIWSQHMLQAAASGHPEAALKLGLLYTGQALGLVPIPGIHQQTLGQILEHSPLHLRSGSIPYPTPTKLQQQLSTHASEWLTIGAEADMVQCNVILAISLRARGEFQKGLEWLNKAIRDSKWESSITFYKERWYDKNFDFVWRADDISTVDDSYSLKSMILNHFNIKE